MTHADDQGRFVLYPPNDAKFYVVAIHPNAGFRLRRGRQFSDSGEVRLLPWATLTSRFDQKARQQQEASLSTRIREEHGFPEVIFSQDSGALKKDPPTDGFRFTHVPPIFETTIRRMFPDKQNGAFGLPGATVSLLPGESRRLDLGPLSDKQREWLESIRRESRSRREKPPVQP